VTGFLLGLAVDGGARRALALPRSSSTTDQTRIALAVVDAIGAAESCANRGKRGCCRATRPPGWASVRERHSSAWARRCGEQYQRTTAVNRVPRIAGSQITPMRLWRFQTPPTWLVVA
jgi:hypothetical protein